MKNKLMSSAPWRGEGEGEEEELANAKLKVTNEPGSTPTMHVPAKKPNSSKSNEHKDSFMELSPELKYGFQRNYKFLQKVSSLETILKPLPLSMQYNCQKNLEFFCRIFTQFTTQETDHSWGLAILAGINSVGSLASPQLDSEGISDVHKSLGLGREEKHRRVHD